MGITGLLPFLKNATRQANIKEFKGCTVAIDSYCWLHRGAFACAEKLALGEPTDQYVYYCMKYVNNLLSFGVRPILVFDGCHLPSKKEVEKQRRERRDVNRKKAAQLLREGRRAEARDALQKCVDITSHMAVELMNACRAKGVDCIVAPYEADAQLAYLNKIGMAQVIITEDSDLVLFGCEKIMFKMDFAGNGVLIERENLNKAMGLKSDIYTFEKFRYMCILSGCDYLASLPGIGLKKATKVFQRTRQEDMKMVLKKIPTTLNMNVTVTADYIEGFFKAVNTFLYQLVYNPTMRKLVPLNPYPDDVDPAQLLYAGPPLNEEKAYQLALGNLDVHSGARIGDFSPDTFQPSSNWDPAGSRGSRDMLCNLSIWDKNYRPKSKFAMENDTNKGSAFDISRGRTKGKEVHVSLKLPTTGKKIKSPSKRHREEDATLTEKQLTDLYADNSTSDASPPAKKPRAEDDKVVDELVFLSSNREEPRVKHQSDEPRRSHTPPLPQIGTGLAAEESDTNHIDSSEEHALSPSSARPSVNKFRVLSAVKKNKFSLNTTTEVTSRFFNSKKPFKKSNFFNKMSESPSDITKSHDNTESDDVIESDDRIGVINVEKNQDTLENVDIRIKDYSPETAALENSQICLKTENCDSFEKNNSRSSQSPYGSFGFSKSKLSAFKSDFHRNSNGKIKDFSTSVSQRPFKPVIEKTNLKDQRSSLSNSNESQVLNASQSSEQFSEEQNSEDNKFTQRSVSLWSIDSFTLSQSQTQNSELSDEELEKSSSQTETQDRDSSNRSAESGVKLSNSRSSLDESKYFDSSVGTESSKSSVINWTENVPEKDNTAKSFPSGKSPKAGCRSSGLSKKSKSQSFKENGTKGQKSITNFFSKFNYDKSSKKKLEAERKPLSPNRENTLSNSN